MSKAFTLAEVLITLGVIGIVASMTLPTVISNNKKKTVEARLQKFYSVANQAIKLSELKNGPKEYWATCTDGLQKPDSTQIDCETWFNTYLKGYLKEVKVEHFVDSNYQNSAVYLADGSVMVIKSGYDIFFYPFAKDFSKEKFSSKNDNGEFTRADLGNKSFAFSFQANRSGNSSDIYKNKGIEPYRSITCENKINENGETEKVCNSLTKEDLINHSKYGCNRNSNRGYCTALIQENGWKIPDDYPFKF